MRKILKICRGAGRQLIDGNILAAASVSERVGPGYPIAHKACRVGMADMSAESLILKYREQFEPNVVEAATNRLREYGIIA